jgi:hypothetical protein
MDISHDNPYQSPQHIGVHQPGRLKDLLKAGGFTLAVSAVCGLAGLGLGALIGTALPGYYRAVFSDGHEPDFDPVGVGMVQGLTQGLVAGLLVGVALVAAWWWYNSRRSRIALP